MSFRLSFQNNWFNGLAAVTFIAFLFFSTAEANDNRVPDFTGVMLKDAEKRALNLGFELVPDFEDSRHRPDEIFDQFPGAGGQTGPDRRIRVQVSKGLAVPDVLGLARDNAVSKLEQLGLSWEITTRPVLRVGEGLVGSVNPPQGTRIDPTTEVVFLVVSEFPSAQIPTDLIGLSANEAKRRLDNSGLSADFDRRIRNNIYANNGWTEYFYTVERSDPPPGQLLREGSQVRLFLKEEIRVERWPMCGNQPC
jgi:serine/threonine-protein kinase